MGFSKSIGRIAALWGMAMIGAACAGNEAKEASSAAPEPIRIGPESVAVVKEEELRTGPIISGQLSAEREATVRAQVGGSIVQTTLDEGQAVSKGAVLARIEARDLNDARDVGAGGRPFRRSGAGARPERSAENGDPRQRRRACDT